MFTVSKFHAFEYTKQLNTYISICSPYLWDNIKKLSIRNSHPDSLLKIPAIQSPFVSYLFFLIFFSLVYATVKQTHVLVFHTTQSICK